ncbi:MAG: gliding motility-associated C-terminal domain-containing protein [Saprospiraceae bacterium]|nr:gliding motility-associated C-terminal domain-containing protein [Saprospiraceae bacterium]
MNYFKKCFFLLLLSSNAILLNSQANTCETAEVLCSLSELDGFTGSMPESNFTGEFPTGGMCPPGSDAPGGTNQNITWFAFIAGSASAVFEITFTNCQSGNQVQYGVYTDCSFSEAIVCFGGGGGVNVSSPITVNLDGMVPGDDYFFFIDGDLGTYCDYEIEVISGGEPVPVPQPDGVLCISGNCPMDGNVCGTGETFTFEPDGLDLSIDYIWTVTPSPPNGTTINGSNEFSATFNSTGMYEICVTGDNGCTQTTPVCYILNVLEADAGMLSADPETLCPGGTSTVTASGYIDSPPIEQAMIAVGPDGTVIGVNSGETIDVTYDECGTVTVYSYNYNPADSPALPNVGDVYTVPNCGSVCCDTESIDVVFEDNEFPTLSGTPADITLECNDMIPTMDPVNWEDNCDGAGTVEGIQDDSYDVCMGGTITRTWVYEDVCMNEVEYIQTITINAQNGGSFDSEPEDMTFDCEADIPPLMDLNWTGDCDGTAVVSPVDSGDADLCSGGQVTRTWSYNDACGGFTEYIQTFTINAANPGEFVDMPEDVTVECDLNDLLPMENLTWMGDCDGTATVVGTEDIDVEPCSGGSITRFWTYTDGCGAVTDHTQFIMVSPPPLAEAINPPPANITFNCDEVPTSFDALSFTNNQVGDCEIIGTADPEVMGDPTICGGTITVVWVFTDDCFNVSSYVQNITILPAPEPAFIGPPADMTISCVEEFPMPDDLDYTNNATGDCLIAGTIEPLVTTEGDICGGDVISIWEFTDECGVVLSHTQTIIIEPLAEPDFIDPPADVTVSCANVPTTAPTLSYTNGESGSCEIMGDVPPVTDNDYDICGGTITNTWEFTDLCSRTFMYQQIITVEPAPEPTFTSLPANITIGCDEIPPTPPSIDYENGEAGDCLISGSVNPTVEDNSNSCGGEVQYIWEFTDPCNRVISHTQLITIEEAPAPQYTTLPTDITVDCGSLPPPAEALAYTNSDPCEIMGTVDPVVDENFTICGGEIVNSWDFTDECGRQLLHIQTITINPAEEAIFQNIPANTTVACGDDATNPGDLEYTNNGGVGCLISGMVSPVQSGGYDACGGEILFTWEFTDICGRVIQHVQTVVIEPASQAVFIDPPAEITVSCEEFNPTPPNLNYTNSEGNLCEISGSVPGMLIGNPSPCGVTVTYRWEFIDDCGRTITHNQDVTIEEAPPAAFLTLPDDITLNCDEVSSTIPSLDYTNNATGVCLISGSQIGIQSGFYNECGGEITYTWTFIDECNRTLSHNQQITVNPAPDPVFIDPPVDITLDCDQAFPVDPPLDYTNNLSGSCAISGTVLPTTVENGTVTTYTWSITNACNGSSVTHTQNVTGVTTPAISIDPLSTSICIGDEFDLSTIVVTDANGNPFTVTFQDQNGTPLSTSTVSPITTSNYLIIATNDSGCSDETTFTINVDSPTNAGVDGSGLVCGANLTYNLFDYIGGNPESGGTWFDTDGSGVNIDNPFSVNFNGVPAGVYNFTYTIFSTNSCPDASATAMIEVIGELEFEILSIECAPGGATYIVNVFPNGNNIFSSLGTVNQVDANSVIISDIPAGELVVISAIDQDAFCISDIFVNPPDCDCPDVESPISNGDLEICEGDDLPELSVTVSGNNTVNWYSDQTSQDPLIEMSLVYLPEVSAPGVYTFYAEAVDEDGCVSLIRTPVTLTINAQPDVTNILVSFCADSDGNVSVDLQSFNAMINSNANFSFLYFVSLMDAEDLTNALDSPFVLSSTSTIYVVVTNTSGCSAIGTVEIEVNPIPTYTLTIEAESCINENDGSIAITDIMPASVEFSLDDMTYTSEVTFDLLSPGNYTVFAITEEQCKVSENVTIEEGVELSYSDLVIMCSDNGTSSDSDDDFYEIMFNLANNQGGLGMVNVSTTSEELGLFNYGAISLNIDAGSPETLTILDIDSQCSIEIDLGDLTPCSTSCELTIEALDIECDGNGTSTDPSDDVYIITINASVINGASNNTFNVLVDGNIVDNFEYGVGGHITISALGQNALITLSDNEDSQCFSSQTIGPLNPCSSECILSIDNQNFICDNNGTIGVPEDDTYNFTFTVLATNSSSSTFELFINGTNEGTYTYGELSTYTLNADGSTPIIEFIDTENQACIITVTVPELNPCSGSCSVLLSLEEIFCNNEATSDDPLDDTYTATISVDLVGGTGTWQIVSTGETGTSGQMVTLGPFLISDGSVTIEVIDPGVSDCVDSIVIDPPLSCSTCDESVEAGLDVELDCDITQANLEGSSSIPGNPSWEGPGGLNLDMYAVSVDVPGTYYFTVDFGEGCIRTDSLVVSVSNDIPQVVLESPLGITCEIDSVVLLAAVNGGSGNFTYQWTNASMSVISTDLSVTVGDIGNYFFEVYDVETDCSSPPVLVEVMDNRNLPDASISADPADVLDCVVNEIFLNPANEPNVIYKWYVDDVEIITESLLIDDAAIIELLAIDTISGCRDSSMLIIENFEEYPLVNIADPPLIDCMNSSVSLDGSASQMGSSIQYTWYDGDGNVLDNGVDEIQVLDEGWYYLELVDTDNNCSNLDSVFVSSNFMYPLIDLSNALEIRCDAETTDVELSIDGNAVDYTISWETQDGSIIAGEDSELLTINSPGTYFVSVQNNENQCETLDTIMVNLPELIAGTEISILDESCAENGDGQIIIGNIIGGTTPYILFINGEQVNDPMIDNLSAASYEVFIVDKNGCSFDSTLMVGQLDPFEIDLEAEITINAGSTSQLIASVTIPDDEILSIEWNPGTGLSCTDCLNPMLTTTTDGAIYEITVTDINGCTATASIQTLVINEVIIVAPNVFTPNQDGNENDNFTIYSNIEGALIQIFDRWGNLVFINRSFSPNDPLQGWDGSFGTTPVNSGVYVFYAEILLPDDEVVIKKGDLTIIR